MFILYDQFGRLIVAPKKHHIWCNFWNRPIETCKMCKDLYKNYPYQTDEEADGLMKKHFPNNIRRT